GSCSDHRSDERSGSSLRRKNMLTLTPFEFCYLMLPTAIHMVICLLAYRVGGATGIAILAVDLGYFVAASIFLDFIAGRYGMLPSTFVWAVVCGWILTTIICLIWSLFACIL